MAPPDAFWAMARRAAWEGGGKVEDGSRFGIVTPCKVPVTIQSCRSLQDFKRTDLREIAFRDQSEA